MSEHRKDRQKTIALSNVPLFQSLPARDLAHFVKNLKTWDAPAGTLILEEGGLGNEFYLILQGQVEIIRARGTADHSHLGLRQPGEVIGEMGLLGRGAPRTATAQAVTDVRLLVVTYDDFNELLKSHPELGYEMASVLSARLTEALNHTISYLHEKNEALQQAYDELQAAQAKIIEKEKLEHSLAMAREIQYSILPTEISQPQGYDIGALMMPAQAVGGDFYGVYPLDERHTALIVGDVSDKGLPAAIFMAQCHALLRASIQSSIPPKVTTGRVNRLLREMNAQELFVTVIYGILDLPSGEFRYTRAGHELPMLLDERGEIAFPEVGTGGALGIWDDPWLDERSLIIPEGGLMFLYSDGITDGRNIDQVRFGDVRFANLVKLQGVKQPSQQICRAVFDSLTEFQNGAPQFDDVTLLAVRRLPRLVTSQP